VVYKEFGRTVAGVVDGVQLNSEVPGWLKLFEVLISVLRSITRRQLVETENPSAYAMVNWKVCKSAVILY
jgi:hypothetical protein